MRGMLPQKIIYRNRSYNLQSSGRYYCRRPKRQCDEALLHRQIYKDNFGEIPDGMVVHHKDGDWTNNDPLNLELKENAEHHREHALEWHANNPSKSKQMIEHARKFASEWHRSPEGRAWHAELSRRTCEAWEYRDYTCLCCGTRFRSRSIGTVKYCSNKCRWKMKPKKK